MTQTVLFHRQVKLGDFTFEPGQSYDFLLVSDWYTQWLYYQGQALITLGYFANLFTDQKHAQWVDQARVA